MQFYFSSGYDAGSWDRAKKAQLENKGKKCAGVVSDFNFFLWVDGKRERKRARDRGESERERRKKYQRVIVEDIGWRRTAQTKNSREIILLPAREGVEGRKQNRKKSKKSFSLVFVLFE